MQTFAKHSFGYASFPLLTLKHQPWPDPEPIVNSLPLFQLGGHELLTVDQATTLDVVVSSKGAQPVIARLYDLDGVLLREGIALGEGSASARAPDGYVPRSRLTAPSLQPGGHYVLQIVPAFDVGPTGMQEISVGLTQ